ncbi:DUF917 family protein [Sporosarcina soli]|uniref:DUF917 family protein n=1 Tax=Sporosarcina soli TaxID=334736 RepID=A0ABW0TPT5_9BACL
MKLETLTADMVEAIVLGGCILGGGGGGSRIEGEEFANLAFQMGEPTFVQLNSLNSDDVVLTVSGVGAPAAKEQYVKPADYLQAIEMLISSLEKPPVAIMTNENGGFATVNGFLQSALLNIPLLDAACNGRAHPTGIMGSMGLNELKDYTSMQVGIGGKKGTSARVELFAKGSLDTCSKMIRQGAVQAGGLVTVARNPVTANYIEKFGAVGAITHAYEVGQAFLKGENPQERVRNVASVLGGEIIVEGNVESFNLITKDGFDLGSFTVKASEDKYDLTFWNEFMSIDCNGERISTFPNLIMTFSKETGLPITSAELEENHPVYIISTPYQNLKLGRGMFVEENYTSVEEVLGIEVKKYISKIFE